MPAKIYHPGQSSQHPSPQRVTPVGQCGMERIGGVKPISTEQLQKKITNWTSTEYHHNRNAVKRAN